MSWMGTVKNYWWKVKHKATPPVPNALCHATSSMSRGHGCDRPSTRTRESRESACGASACQNPRMEGLSIDAAVGSDAAHRSTANFDVTYLTQQPLAAVIAAGTGGGLGSAAPGRTIVDVFVDYATRAPESGPSTLRAAVAAAHATVSRIGWELRDLAGCTPTALVATARGCLPVRIGDSRVYSVARRAARAVDHRPHDGLAGIRSTRRRRRRRGISRPATSGMDARRNRTC